MESTFDNNPSLARGVISAPGDAEYISRRELDAIMRFLASTEEMWRLGHLREHELIEVARVKAETLMSARLESMNELRSQIDRERGNYITRDVLDAKMDAVRIQGEIITKSQTETNKALSMLTTRVMVTGTVLAAIFAAAMGIAQLVWHR
ncbi:MAG: hypothetical protein NVS9B4_00680 [Candidatus Acidiferrum sp.]